MRFMVKYSLDRAFSLMELLVAVFIIGIVMGTIYFSLDNLRLVFQKEKKMGQSQKNLESLFYQLSLWSGKAKLIKCNQKEIHFIYTKYISQSFQNKDASDIGTDNQEHKKVTHITNDFVLSKVQMNNKIYYYLQKQISFYSDVKKMDTLKKNNYLFYENLTESNFDTLNSNALSKDKLINESQNPVIVQWHCEKYKNNQTLMKMQAFSQNKNKKRLLRQRSFLFAWERTNQ